MTHSLPARVGRVQEPTPPQQPDRCAEDFTDRDRQVRAFLDQQRFIDALKLLEQAISYDQITKETYEFLGEALHGIGRNREAIEALNAACFYQENPWQCLSFMGDIHMDLKEYDEAIIAYRGALVLKPDLVLQQAGIAQALFHLGKLDEALCMAHQAVTRVGKHPYPYYILGLLQLYCGEISQSISSLEMALRIDSNHAPSHTTLGLALLVGGGFGYDSWNHYSWRLKMPPYATAPESFRELPIWDGSAVEGRVLFWPEQGIGDSIFSLRFPPHIKLPPQQIMLAVDYRLQRLCERSLPGIQVLGEQPVEPGSLGISHTYPLCSGGLLVEETILSSLFDQPWPCPFLIPAVQQMAQFRSELVASGAKRIIGISWFSDPEKIHGKDKSVDLAMFHLLAELEGVQLVDLQYGDTALERESFTSATGHHVYSTDFDKREDLDTLVALIAACDEVVTVSNATAHLAGALGKKGIVLLPAGKGLTWYWLRTQTWTPWYPTLSLVRQQRAGQWEEEMRTIQNLIRYPSYTPLSR